MLLCTTSAPAFRAVGEIKGIDMLAQAGFDAIDFTLCDMGDPSHPRNSCDISAYTASLRRIASDAGILFRQAHGPMPCMIPGNDDFNRMILPTIHRAIRIAGALGAKVIVLHPIISADGGEAQKAANLTFFSALSPIAEDSGIKIAIENTCTADPVTGRRLPNGCSFGWELRELIDALGTAHFTACLDVGHNAIAGEDPACAIRALDKERLEALHIHDNDGIHDQHLLPCSPGCVLDWDTITAALGEIGYAGDFTFEADSYTAPFDPFTLPSALRHMTELGRALIEKIEKSAAQRI